MDRSVVRNALLSSSLICLMAGGASLSQADDLFGRDVIFEPKLGVTLRHDDNLSQAADGQTKYDSLVTVIEPGFRVGAEGNKASIIGEYNMKHEAFDYDSVDDYTGHHLDLTGEAKLNARNTLGANVGYHKQQDIRTSINRADPQEKTGDRYNWRYFGGFYKAGAESSRFQLELSGEQEVRRFENNLDTASDNRSKERDTDTFIGTLYARIAPKTKLLLEAKQRDFDYIAPSSPLDNTSNSVFLGLTWEATAKTTGSVRLGQENKEFDRAGATDYSEPSWDISVSWQPNSYSTISLFTTQGAQEGSIRSDLIKTASTTVSWSHNWNPKFNTEFSYNMLNEQYEGLTFDGREDETESLSANAAFTFMPGAELNAGVTAKTRGSSSAIEEFDRTIAHIGVAFFL